MSSYVVTGASRGIGFEFIRQLSSNPANTVIGMVRNKAATEVKVAELGRANLHIVEGDLTNHESLKKAAEATEKITGGSLDYLIANGALLSQLSPFDGLGELGADPVALDVELQDQYKTNVVGNIHLFNAFVPLILKGQKKKVIGISSGFGDLEFNVKYGLYESGPYSISKAAFNMVIAKYAAEYADKDVLFLSICPGMVDTGAFDKLPAELAPKVGALMAKFQKAAPDFKGASSPEESVKAVISVYEKASVAGGDSGDHVSHFGNKTWL